MAFGLGITLEFKDLGVCNFMVVNAFVEVTSRFKISGVAPYETPSSSS